jgi:L-2,4-diaminobutyrate decarboxylase
MDVTAFRTASHAAVDELASYAERPDRAVARRSPATVAAKLNLHRLLRDGGLDAATFPAWLRDYLDESVRLHHAGYMAHQISPPDVGGALADIVHAVADQPMSIYEMGSGAASVELAVVDWMVEKVGWSVPESGGVLTHGGSLANMTALLAARAHAAPDAWKHGVDGSLAILAPPSAHYSVARAAGMMGLGEDAVVPLDVDALGRIDVVALPDALQRLGGRTPIALVAGACATTTGLYDDLRAIAHFCRAHGIWFHVDGAHGASALLSVKHRGLLDGIELADSVIWDAHKMLRTTALCAAVLVRRSADLPQAFQQHATYIDFSNAEGVDVIDRQVECTKAELGLKVFLSLAFAGEQGAAGYVEDQYAKALALWRMVRERPGFSAPYRPQSNILCFRYCGADQLAIREELLGRGDFYLTSAEIDGVRHLRVSLMSPATDETTLAAMLDAIEDVARARAAA